MARSTSLAHCTTRSRPALGPTGRHALPGCSISSHVWGVDAALVGAHVNGIKDCAAAFDSEGHPVRAYGAAGRSEKAGDAGKKNENRIGRPGIARQKKIGSNSFSAVSRTKTHLFPSPIGCGVIYGFHTRI